MIQSTHKPRFNKTLLIVPPFYRMTGAKNNWIHLGCSYVGATLASKGHEVKIYNTDHVEDIGDISLRQTFQGQNIYEEILADPNHTIWKEVEHHIREYKPDLIGITIVFSKLLKAVIRIAEIAKSINPEIKICVGGPHASLLPNTLEKDCFDYLVKGEGEYPFLELVEGKPLSEIAGLVFKDKNGKLIENTNPPFVANIDEFAHPRLDLQLIEIKDPENNFGTMAFSRGCNLKCIFCSSPALWGDKIRYRSIENVMEEMEDRYFNHGVKRYYFADDNMTLNRKYAKRFMREIIDKGMKINYLCESRVNTFDDELCELMYEAGCRRIKLGVESGSDKMLKYMKKAINVKQIYRTAELLKKYNLPFTAYVLLGLPTETKQDIEETYKVISDIDPDYISLSIATPQFGTELYTIAQDLGIGFPEDMWSGYSHQSNTCLFNENVTQEVIDRFLKLNEQKDKSRLVVVDC